MDAMTKPDSAQLADPVDQEDASLPAAPAKPPAPEQQPWRSSEDRQGWHVIARGRGVGAPLPLIRVEVALDRAQSDWVAAAATRAGVDYATFIKSLIDDAHGRAAATDGAPANGVDEHEGQRTGA
jgi:hypothetical protein